MISVKSFSHIVIDNSLFTFPGLRGSGSAGPTSYHEISYNFRYFQNICLFLRKPVLEHFITELDRRYKLHSILEKKPLV